MSLHEELSKIPHSQIYPFHMPGHKRKLKGQDPYSYDITEIRGFDDLHGANGIIKDEQERIAALYGAKSCRILTGGGTLGNLAALWACLGQGDEVMIARNCHRSVYNACIVRGAKVRFVCPDFKGGIYTTLPAVRLASELCKYPNVKAVVVTSPTYEGFVSDIRALSAVAHVSGAALIADSAHGAHLGFDNNFPASSVSAGADLVAVSTHKTLPALTQTALLLNCSDKVKEERISEALDIFESSSPSYVLMDSVSACFDYIEERPNIFGDFAARLYDFYKSAAAFKALRLEHPCALHDPSKLLIWTDRAHVSGKELYTRLLEDYGIETEEAGGSFVLALTSIADNDAGFIRLKKALSQLDARVAAEILKGAGPKEPVFSQTPPPLPEKAMEMHEAAGKNSVKIPLEDSKGRISADFVCICPPNSPVIVPGEIISAETADYIKDARAAGLNVTGAGEEISVISD